MDGRIRWINHRKKQVLMVDLSTCTASDVERLVRMIPDYVTAKPLASVLILTDFTGASFDQEAARAIKEVAVFDKPHVKKSAWLGAESLPLVFKKNVETFSRRQFSVFENQQQALDWLTTD
jgi:hypothetical protein